MPSTTFKNELGNTIRGSVTSAPTEKGAQMVNIRLAGPKSVSENIVTEMEARELVKLISAHLGDEATIIGGR